MDQLLSVGYAICGFTILILLSRKEDSRSVYYGALLMFVWFLRFLSFVLKENVDLESYSFLILFDTNLFLLDGLILYWYVSSFIKKNKPLMQFIGLIPYLFFLSLSIVVFIALDSKELYVVYLQMKIMKESRESSLNINELVFFTIAIGMNLFFVIKSFIVLKSYQRSLLENLSNMKKVNINWLFNLLFFWILFLLVPFISFSLNYLFKNINMDIMENIFLSGLILVSIYFAYHILKHDHAKDLFIELKNKSSKVIDIDLLQQRFDLLTALMIEKKPYKESDLTLKRLAEMSGFKPNELSQVIKIKNESNFYEFVNQYRIDSVKNDLINSNEQIIIIAYNNGFNSKSTFNTAFKKMTNYTPSGFRNEFGKVK